MTSKAARFGFFITVILAAILVLLAPKMIPWLFGGEFVGALPAFFLLLPGVLAFSLTNVLASYIIGRGLPQYNTCIAGVSLVINIMLSIFLIPRWAILGAAVATSGSYVAATLVALYLYRKLTREPLGILLIPQLKDWKLVFYALMTKHKDAAR